MVDTGNTPTKTPHGGLAALYRPSLGLLADLYQLTMGNAYFERGLADRQAVFHLTFRKNPFGGGFAIAAGLDPAIDFIEGARFSNADCDYLASLTGNDGEALMSKGFIDYLRTAEIRCDVDAVPEGTAVFPHEPLLRVRGPLLWCQLLETALLNLVNFNTLIATKSARICSAAEGDPVLEFGLRRAQGIDGGLSASRAAYIGGCAGTSNVLAGKLYGIPVRGTHAHSWVMCFDDEQDAFEAYADVMPNNCVFLVDTYDTIEGVKKAITVARGLRKRGHEIVGIRLDSGDLAWLSIEARKLLDDAGFDNAVIVASNDLDERLVQSLKHQGAKIGMWGVGTKLATAYDQPALGGVYKLSALKDADGTWQHRIKLSEQAIKISNPGIQQVRRYSQDGRYVADMIIDELQAPAGAATMIDQLDPTMREYLGADGFEDLLVPIFRDGALVYDRPSLDSIRAHVASELARLPDGVRRFDNPHRYPVGLEHDLYDTKMRLVLEARGKSQ